MGTYRRPPTRRHWTWIAWSCAFGFAACSFQPQLSPVTCSDFLNVQATPLAAQSSQVVFEQVGTVIAIHGSGTAKIDHKYNIRVEQSQMLPLYANQATVYLNGWRTAYPGSDHHVVALSTLIGKINLAVDPDRKTNVLTWDAIGLLADNSAKAGLTWTYNFTVIAWNSAALNAAVDQGGGPGGQYCAADGTYVDNYFIAKNANTNTALSSFASFIHNPAFATAKAVAVLPRGFGYVWSSEDHHVRQAAYNLDHSEIYADRQTRYNKQSALLPAPLPDAASHADSGFVSWGPYAIFKDNDTRRDYFFAELVSAMAGADVGVIQPPYAVLPADDGSSIFSGCGSNNSNGVVSQDFVVEDVPFQFAAPMLTGWDLQYLCDDHHVRDVGIWIDHWTYQPPGPGAAGGTLRYTLSSILRDDDNNGFAANGKVTILGLRPISGGKAGAPPAQDQTKQSTQ